MSTDDTPTTETPENIAKLANEPASLPALALLGVFGSATTRKALIRTPYGNTITVSTGDPVKRDIVVAITDDRVVLARGSGTKTLRLPAT